MGTQLLVMGIMAVTDTDNAGASPGVAPLFIGLVVTLIGMTFGMNSGYAINPARDLGPRLFTAIAGWGTEVFTLVLATCSVCGKEIDKSRLVIAVTLTRIY
jgi:glycerol uptake facilitator-like aquaporin